MDALSSATATTSLVLPKGSHYYYHYKPVSASVCYSTTPLSCHFRPLSSIPANQKKPLICSFRRIHQQQQQKQKCEWNVRVAQLESSTDEPGGDQVEDSALLSPDAEKPVMGLNMSRRKKLRMILNAPKKQKLVLKFLWLEKSIGLALDQLVPGYGNVPLSPYFFWPRKDAWEELKATLESKPWISRKRAIILLNQATDIINLWQQRGSNV